MTQMTHTCAVCGALESLGTGMSRVVIEGRALCLCRPHAATVVTEMPATFDEMRALFVGLGASRLSQAGTAEGTHESGRPDLPFEERRSPITRRSVEDRRVFPPRFEGRRSSSGRRAGDPVE
jgi:hypothetical protein